MNPFTDTQNSHPVASAFLLWLALPCTLSGGCRFATAANPETIWGTEKATWHGNSYDSKDSRKWSRVGAAKLLPLMHAGEPPR